MKSSIFCTVSRFSQSGQHELRESFGSNTDEDSTPRKSQTRESLELSFRQSKLAQRNWNPSSHATDVDNSPTCRPEAYRNSYNALE
jgi:hypothetical protein